VKKLTGGFDNGLGAVLIGKHSLVLFLSRKSLEGILGLFQQYRSKAAHSFHARMSAATSCGHGPSSESDVMGHVWTAPGWQGISSRVQQWSEQPCVRPVSAVHVTAGHNALRGSGPGHNLAFDNALAQVGCPDRRIDRLCITCCSPFPTVTSRRMPDAISFYAASATGSL